MIHSRLYATVLWVEFLVFVGGSEWVGSLTPSNHWEMRIDLASVELLLFVRIDEIG